MISLCATNLDKLAILFTCNKYIDEHSFYTISLKCSGAKRDDINAHYRKSYKGVSSDKFNIYIRRNEIFVEFNTFALWTNDIGSLWKDLISVLIQYPVEIISHKIMRLDYAIDFYYKRDLIASLKNKRNIYFHTQKEAETYYKNNMSLTYGKSPDNSVIIYNKSAEIAKYGSTNHKPDLCEDNNTLYRLEYRCGGQLLSNYGIKTFEDVKNKYFNMLYTLMDRNYIASTHKKSKKNGKKYKNVFQKCRLWSSLIKQIKSLTGDDLEKLTRIQKHIPDLRKATNFARYVERFLQNNADNPEIINQALSMLPRNSIF